MCVLPACIHAHKCFIKVDVVGADASAPIPRRWSFWGNTHFPSAGPGAEQGRAGLTLFQRQTMNITEYFVWFNVGISIRIMKIL